MKIITTQNVLLSFHAVWFKLTPPTSKVLFEAAVALERNGTRGGRLPGWELFLLKLPVPYEIEYNTELEETIAGCK